MFEIIKKFKELAYQEFLGYLDNEGKISSSSHGTTHSSIEIVLDSKILIVTIRHSHITPWGNLKVDEEFNRSLFMKNDDGNEVPLLIISQQFTDWKEGDDGVLVEGLHLKRGV